MTRKQSLLCELQPPSCGRSTLDDLTPQGMERCGVFPVCPAVQTVHFVQRRFTAAEVRLRALQRSLDFADTMSTRLRWMATLAARESIPSRAPGAQSIPSRCVVSGQTECLSILSRGQTVLQTREAPIPPLPTFNQKCASIPLSLVQGLRGCKPFCTAMRAMIRSASEQNRSRPAQR